jgi:DNA-binding XRE family transcriptional regulator/predicted RNase H-like HicB family nuclease
MLYLARITHEGNATLADFPDCPGCQTFARAPLTIDAIASDALHGWLEATLDTGQPVPHPRSRLTLQKGERALPVQVSPALAARIALRWARDEAGMSQAEVAARMGVSPQAVSRVERSAGDASITTLARYAAALGARLSVRIDADVELQAVSGESSGARPRRKRPPSARRSR